MNGFYPYCCDRMNFSDPTMISNYLILITFLTFCCFLKFEEGGDRWYIRCWYKMTAASCCTLLKILL